MQLPSPGFHMNRSICSRKGRRNESNAWGALCGNKLQRIMRHGTSVYALSQGYFSRKGLCVSCSHFLLCLFFFPPFCIYILFFFDI